MKRFMVEQGLLKFMGDCVNESGLYDMVDNILI